MADASSDAMQVSASSDASGFSLRSSLVRAMQIVMYYGNPANGILKLLLESESSSDEEVENQSVFANEDSPRKEEHINEEDQRNEEDQQPIHSLLKNFVTELKSSQLRDGELENILKDLKSLFEVVYAVIRGEPPVHMREAERNVTTRNVDRRIPWPPMVILVNAKYHQDDNEKWIGMGEDEALELFSCFGVVGSKSSYGPQGHRGMTVLIFEASVKGFMLAKLLDKKFERLGIGLESWRRTDRELIYPDGVQKIYGFMARKSNIDNFNKYFIGDECELKAEIRSYQEMVVNPMKQICEDYDTLTWFKNFMDKASKKGAHMEKFVKMLPRELREELKRSFKEDHQSRYAACVTSFEMANEDVSRDREIVWPPMVIILNTELDKFANGERLGMGDDEVLKHFEGYQAVRSQQSYGPEGHRGMSALIFRTSAVGFMDAMFLSEKLKDNIKDQDGCSCPEHRVLRDASGQRILYGHVAEEHDMQIFNKDARGESELKFELRSYQEMVLNPMKQMCQDFGIWKRYMSEISGAAAPIVEARTNSRAQE